MMLDEAVSRGATLIQGKAIRPQRENGSITGAQIRMADSDKLEDIESEVLLDCSGQATWLASLGGFTGPKYLGAYDKQIAFFSQITNTVRDNGGTRETDKDNTVIFYQKKYHWGWFIPLDEEVVSVGIVCPSAYFLDKKESKRDFYIRELRELHPELSRRIPEIKLVQDVHDSFWEHPLSFAHCVYSRYTEYMTDMFAGRIYGHERQPTPALHSFRKLLKREGERERSYESSDLYSIPIGSRYHPERAAI